MKKFVTLAFAAAVLMSSIGCSSFNPFGAAEKVPDLPSEKSMAIPPLASQNGAAKSALPASNYAFTLAYSAVSYWTATVQLALLEPYTLFQICHSARPQPLPDNSGWVWSVSDNRGFSAKLTGKVENDMVQWNMSVTGGNLVDFVWFTGSSVVTGRSGTWTFYDSAKVNGQCPASIQFAYEISDVLDTVSVSNVNTNSADLGSYLKWTEAGQAMAFEAYGAQKQEKVHIAWDKTTEAGSIENLVTGEKACWDTRSNNHADIACQ